MVRRIASVCVLACLASPANAEQAAPPKLNKAQREALHAVVSAVDAAAAAAETSDATWQTHTLRASDGSHYVAFSASSPGAPLPPTPVVLYVRLASRAAPATPTAERSAVMEWLQGLRNHPLPLRPAQAMSVPSGELPVGGTTTMSTRQAGAGESSAALALVSRHAERERDRKAERDRQRKAELDGSQPALPNPLFPFEDFDVAANAIVTASGVPILQRGVTAGPGDYDLYVGWVNAADRSATVRVLKKTLTLPAARSVGVALSSIILADAVSVRDTAYPAGEQTAHPYAIGATDITPASDEIFTSAERLALVVQVINPQPTPTGKPDV
ncbi:MAG: hypothetical protein LC791_18620, partial [Acidobacteria bacterium]|nr:hypothetical protein [Acidobacteriota bacterium]